MRTILYRFTKVVFVIPCTRVVSADSVITVSQSLTLWYHPYEACNDRHAVLTYILIFTFMNSVY